MPAVKTRILGIDPGIAITGYAVVEYTKSSYDEDFDLITSGSIQTDKSLKSPCRLLEIHNDLEFLLEKYTPDVAAVEKIFYFKNAKTIMPVSEARGVITMTLRKFNLPIFDYTPLEIKQTITGFGRAEKCDVKQMVEIILSDCNLSKLDDTIDAVAIAICHARMNI
ncbi:MAG: crossover junction endodeoxyribonuclease RuvC [bacterium]